MEKEFRFIIFSIILFNLLFIYLSFGPVSQLQRQREYYVLQESETGDIIEVNLNLKINNPEISLYEQNTGTDGYVCKKQEQRLITEECDQGEEIRYYYDSVENTCVLFWVPICENNTNFLDFESCKKNCNGNNIKKQRLKRYKRDADEDDLLYQEESVERVERKNKIKNYSKPKPNFPKEFCNLKKEHGHQCPGLEKSNFLEAFYYDKEQDRCIDFVYNGCGGGPNRFFTMWECYYFCGKDDDNILQTFI